MMLCVAIAREILKDKERIQATATEGPSPRKGQQRERSGARGCAREHCARSNPRASLLVFDCCAFIVFPSLPS